MQRRSLSVFQIVMAFGYALTFHAAAADWYVSVDGKQTNAGTKESPWDLISALDGAQKQIGAGDTVWIAAGTYKHPDRKAGSRGYSVKLKGAADKPVNVRGERNARVTIDGGMNVQQPAADLWIRDLEIIVSEPVKEVTQPNIPIEEIGRPWGGLEIQAGTNCKYINLVIHDNCQGIGFWSGAHDSELYGCIIYDNGWKGPDRGHGHCVYSQNNTGIKTISNCIMSARFDGAYTMHCYGSKRADVENYLAEKNIVYECGNFLIGGGKPSRNIRVLNNYLHGVSMQIGYGAENEDCEIRDNMIARGGLTIQKYAKAVNENNTIIKDGDKLTAQPVAVLLPNKYDAARAHVAVYNFQKAAEAPLSVAGFLKPGDSYRVLNPRDFYGQPLQKGKCAGETIKLPVSKDFEAFVLLKEE